MHTMRIGLLVFGLAMGAALFAQDPPAKQQDKPSKSESDGPKDDRVGQGQKRLAEVQARLKLTPEQQEKVRPIVIEEMKQLRAARDEMQSSGQRPRDRMKAGRKVRSIQDDTEAKLKPILSKEQMAEYKKIREERKAEIRRRAAK